MVKGRGQNGGNGTIPQEGFVNRRSVGEQTSRRADDEQARRRAANDQAEQPSRRLAPCARLRGFSNWGTTSNIASIKILIQRPAMMV